MFGLLDLFGFDTDQPQPTTPKETPMKKHKIREMLQAILDKLEAKDTSGDVRILEARLSAANKRAEDAMKKAAQAHELEEQLKRKTQEAGHLKNRLEETERDRDAWKRECERYQAGGGERLQRDESRFG